MVTQEEQIKQQRSAFTEILPTLQDIKTGGTTDFTVHTYEGIEGFKQMLWNELKIKDECLCIGYGTLEDLVPNRRWVEKQRQMAVEAGYKIKEIANPGHTPEHFTINKTYLSQHYERRLISRSLLPINQLTVIYRNTVSTYGLQNDRRVGVEIICKTYAETMRHIFNHYWELADLQEQKSI